MQNIYKVWNQYNKSQSQHFKGEAAHRWQKWAEEQAGHWGKDEYPKGEDWKYVKFDTLPNMNLGAPDKKEKNEITNGEDSVRIEIKNFNDISETIECKEIPGLVIESGLEALEDASYTVLQQNFPSNPFHKVAQSFVGVGCSLKFTKDYKSEKPVRIVFQLDQFDQKDLFVPYNLRVHSESSTEPHVLIEVQGSEFEGVTNLNCEVSVTENSNLYMALVERGSSESRFFSNLTGKVGKHGSLSVFDLTSPSHWSRHNSAVDLDAEGAFVNLSGIYLNHKDYFTDHHTLIRHKKPYTNSKEDYRGILNDKARAVFNGQIKIDPFAVKSDSDQINKNLMLSSSAEVDTKPELQIYNDDVKAAHGATIGQLDDDQKFYLQSRGYSSLEADSILARAFVYDLLEDQTEWVQKFITEDLDRYLSLVQGE